MANDTVQIVFRGTPEFRTKLQRAALDRQVKVQQLIEQALDAYLGNVVSMPEPDSRDQVILRAFRKYLKRLAPDALTHFANAMQLPVERLIDFLESSTSGSTKRRSRA